MLEEGGRGVLDPCSNFDAESKSAKIQNSLCRGGGERIPYVGGGGGCRPGPLFQLMMLRLNLPESKFPMLGEGGGGRGPGSMFQLLMLRPNLLKSKIPTSVGRGGGETSDENLG